MNLAIPIQPRALSWFHRRFREELERSGRPFVLAEGAHEQRLAMVIGAIDSRLL